MLGIDFCQLKSGQQIATEKRSANRDCCRETEAHTCAEALAFKFGVTEYYHCQYVKEKFSTALAILKTFVFNYHPYNVD